MDRLAERADRLGEGAFPVDWLVREVERLSKEHPREDPYWDDAVAVYRVLDHAADLAFEDEIERARLRELREELRQEDMEWY
jgi:hypothetical protein